MKPRRLEESPMIAAAPEQAFAWADDPLDVARVTRCGALLAGACARPAVVVTAPGPGVPATSDVYRVQMEDTQGGTSTVVEARGRV